MEEQEQEQGPGKQRMRIRNSGGNYNYTAWELMAVHCCSFLVFWNNHRGQHSTLKLPSFGCHYIEFDFKQLFLQKLKNQTQHNNLRKNKVLGKSKHHVIKESNRVGYAYIRKDDQDLGVEICCPQIPCLLPVPAPLPTLNSTQTPLTHIEDMAVTVAPSLSLSSKSQDEGQPNLTISD